LILLTSYESLRIAIAIRSDMAVSLAGTFIYTFYMMHLTAWIKAARLRTLPLAVACMGMGAFLAAFQGFFNLALFVALLSTTVLLQVLSNLANDYGDYIHGADSEHRQGEQRMVQSGLITPSAMKRGIILLAVSSFISGLCLLFLAFPDLGWPFWGFIGLGLLAIWAAINYTAGSNPYGYVGLGDISVFLFFGLLAVCGSYVLFSASWWWASVLPAMSCGFLSTAVLNLNNIRDIDSDALAGKKSVALRLGKANALVYHALLLALAFGAAVVFTLLHYLHWTQFIFLASAPIFFIHWQKVKKEKESKALDPMLKQLALSTLVFVLMMGIPLLFV